MIDDALRLVPWGDCKRCGDLADLIPMADDFGVCYSCGKALAMERMAASGKPSWRRWDDKPVFFVQRDGAIQEDEA